jgi:hypothetical protein
MVYAQYVSTCLIKKCKGNGNGNGNDEGNGKGNGEGSAQLG